MIKNQLIFSCFTVLKTCVHKKSFLNGGGAVVMSLSEGNPQSQTFIRDSLVMDNALRS